MITLITDDKEMQAEDGVTVLQACLDNDIYIPHLCYMKEMDNPPGSCRLCFVEIEGFSHPVTSCRVRAKDGMIVRTYSERVRRLQRTAFELLLSVHHIDCRNCPANKKCELQSIAKFLHVGLKPKRLNQLKRKAQIDQSHPFLEYVPDRCVLCGKCIFVCKQKMGQAMLGFAQRGFETIISFFGEEEKAYRLCKECYACSDICPVAALIKK